MKYCCRQIKIGNTELRVYPSGSIWRLGKQTKKWTLVKKTLSSNGYSQISIDDKKYIFHRIIAHAYFGFDLDSPLHIDHRDRNRSNNGIWNLRVVTHQENNWNTGAKGVCRHLNGWLARVHINSNPIQKRFKTEAEALQWREEMKQQLHTINEVDYKKVFSQVLRNI
jgi:hypothetical protein